MAKRVGEDPLESRPQACLCHLRAGSRVPGNLPLRCAYARLCGLDRAEYMVGNGMATPSFLLHAHGVSYK